MLADPRHSRVVLVNLTRGEPIDSSIAFAARRRASLSLLPIAVDMFGVAVTVVGEYQPARLPEQVAHYLARFLPNSISRSRLSAGSFTLPSAVLSDAITAAFDRRGGFPTSCMSSSCKSIRSPNVRTLRATRGLDDPLRSILRSISNAHSSPSLRCR